MDMEEQEVLDDLADRLKRSDQEAYAKIFYCMQEPLLRYLFRFTKDEAMALDVLQDVFLKLWEKRTEIEVRVSLKALLYTMARNRALNVNRNQSRIKYDTELIQENSTEVAESMVEHEMEAGQLDVFFKKWIKELPPRRGEAFILSRFHAMSNKEIGDVMGLSKRTVDTHIVHALRHLRKRYNQLGTTHHEET